MRIILSFIICFLGILPGQIKPPDGLRENPPGVWALINSSVHTEPGTILEDAIIIIRDGIIENAGIDINIPEDATTLDMSGKTIYPGFIDSWVEIPARSEDMPHHDAHWNFKVHARREMSQLYKPDEKILKNLHTLGFTAAHIVPDSGIFQGQTALVQLNNAGTILTSAVAQDLTYEVDGWGSKKYPNALLGVVALMRQTFIDANWYREASEKTNQFPQLNEPLKKNKDLAIISRWISNNSPFIFETNHELTVLRSFNIADEFQLKAWIQGSGYEYRRVSEIAAESPFIILPLNFPVTPDLSNPYQALSYNTSELKHWDIAPDNPAILSDHGIAIALTSHDLDGKEFRKNLSRSVDRGLSETHALAALTTVPAEQMGKSNQLGKIKAGFLANLTVVDGNYFHHKSQIVSTWIGGEEYSVTPKYDVNIDGKWELTVGDKSYPL